jgi:hypothetical protein
MVKFYTVLEREIIGLLDGEVDASAPLANIRWSARGRQAHPARG